MKFGENSCFSLNNIFFIPKTLIKLHFLLIHNKFIMALFSNLLEGKKKNYKLGIALSGGGVRGFAHLGILKALNEKDIYPDIISGTSAGALAGIFYADGYSPDESFEIFYDNSIFKFTELGLPKKGFLSIDKVSKILRKHIKAKTFEELEKPLTVAASNLTDGKVEYFNSGDIIDKVVASASIPVLFKPRIINGKTFVDGGVFDNLPVAPIKDKCDKLIASHVNPVGKQEKLDSILQIAERTFHLAVSSKLSEKSKDCDLFIEPEILRKYGILSIGKGKEIFEVGYKATLELLEKTNPF